MVIFERFQKNEINIFMVNYIENISLYIDKQKHPVIAYFNFWVFSNINNYILLNNISNTQS